MGGLRDVAAMLDITSATVSRIGNTNVLQAVIKVRSAIDRTKIGSGIGIAIHFGDFGSVSAVIGGIEASDLWSCRSGARANGRRRCA